MVSSSGGKKGPKGTHEVAESSRFKLAEPGAVTTLRVRGTGQHIELPSAATFTLGRVAAPGDPPEPRATVCLPSEGKGTSLVHALFEWRQGRLWCRDAGSTNGTFANRQQQHDWFCVTSGMRLDLGDASIIAMETRLAELCKPLAWCLGLRAHRDIDRAINLVQLGGPLLLLGPRHHDQELLARQIHEASGRREYPFTALTTKLGKGAASKLVEGRFGSVFVDLAAVGKVTDAFANELFAGDPPHLHVRPIIAARNSLESHRAFMRLGEAHALELPPIERRSDELPALFDLLMREHSSPCRLQDLGNALVERLVAHEWTSLREVREAERRIRAYLETPNRTQAASKVGSSRQAYNKFLRRIFGDWL